MRLGRTTEHENQRRQECRRGTLRACVTSRDLRLRGVFKGVSTRVAVGTAVTRCPPHRPVLALLTHTVPTSDIGMFSVEAHVRIGLQDLDWWQQDPQALTKTIPAQMATLAPSPKRLKPDAQHVVAERLHPRPVAWNGVIFKIPPHHLPQPLPRSAYTTMHPSPQLRSNLLQLRCHALADRLAVYREVARLVVGPTDLGETQKIEGLRLPFSSLLPSLSGIAPEFNQARLVRVQFQPELPQPFPQLLQELLCFFSMLEPEHGIIGIAH